MHIRYCKIALFLSLLINVDVIAEEIEAFKVTKFDGDFILRYLYDQQLLREAGTETSKDIRPTFQEELKLSSSSYIYHPKLLKMDIGGSLLLDQSEYESISSKTSTEKELINFNSRFQFLAKKPYPVTLYYNQQNPSTSNAGTARFIQENIKYGVNASVMKPLSPVLITLKAYRQTLQGESSDQIVNEDKEQATLRLYSAPVTGTHRELTHQESQLVSNSGSPNLPIQQRETATTQTNFNSKDVFGVKGAVKLTTNLTRKIQEQYPVGTETSFSPAVNWKHNKNLNSFYRLNLLEATEELIDKDIKKINTGVSYQTKVFNTGVSLRAEESITTKLDSNLLGINYKVSNKFLFNKSNLKLSFNSRYDVRDQVASSDLAEVYGEAHVLEGLEIVKLNRNNIDTLTIVVTNSTRTQTYVEGLDYRLIELGSEVSIQRFIDGNILDKQTVLVDYSYQTGGTFAYDVATNNLNLNWSIQKIYDLYLRYRDTYVDLTDGNPTIQLNSINSVTAGMRMNKSLLNGLKIGGEIYQENREEDINPYIKQNAQAFVELPLRNLTNIRVSAKRVIQDNEYSDEDVDSETLTVRVNSRPWLRGKMSVESSYKNDVGGVVARLVVRHRLRLSWKIRQLSLGASINYRKEQQDLTERQRWDARFTASRKF